MDARAIPDNFADYPPLLSETRQARDQSVSLTPREELIALLRDIDAGKLIPTSIFVVFEEDLPDMYGVGHRNGCASVNEAIGLMERAKHRMLTETNGSD